MQFEQPIKRQQRVFVGVNVPAEDYAILRSRATQERRSLSFLIRDAIHLFLHGTTPNQPATSHQNPPENEVSGASR
jgi:hypothetical protein